MISKRFSYLALAIFMIFSVFTLSACGHTHTYNDAREAWTIDKAATLFEDGEKSRYCTDENCNADDKGKQTEVITALGKTNELYDFFNFYNDNLERTDTGVKLGQIVDSDDTRYGGAIGIAAGNNDNDGVYELEDGVTTISFTLDLSTFEENDYSIFTMNFLQKLDGDPNREYVTESIFGVIKTTTGYTVSALNGVNYTEADRDQILSSENKVEIVDDDNILTFGYQLTYDSTKPDAEKLGVKLLVNGEEKITFAIYYSTENTANGISRVDGIGTLWNATSNKDTAVMSNLVKE